MTKRNLIVKKVRKFLTAVTKILSNAKDLLDCLSLVYGVSFERLSYSVDEGISSLFLKSEDLTPCSLALS
jgi:hypothetical protein